MDVLRTSTYLEIAPGEKGCFAFTGYTLPIGYENISLGDVRYTLGEKFVPRLSIRQLTSSINRGYFHVSGRVVNDDSVTVRDIMVAGTYYNGSGQAVGCSIRFSSPGNFLDPGQSALFGFQWATWTYIADYKVKVSGR